MEKYMCVVTYTKRIICSILKEDYKKIFFFYTLLVKLYKMGGGISDMEG